MDRFDDVSVVASVDESPPPPRVSRGARRAFSAVVASVVVTGGLAGAAVGLADEKTEPSKSATDATKRWTQDKRGGRECRRGERLKRSGAGALRY